MKASAFRVLRKYAKIHALDLAWVDSMQKDFGILIRNLPKIKTYSDGAKVRDALIIYAQRFNTLIFDEWLNRKSGDFPENIMQMIDKEVRGPAWNFYVNMSLPLDRPDKYQTEDECLARFLRLS